MVKLIVIVVLFAIVAAVAATIIQQLLFGRTYTAVTGGAIGAMTAIVYLSLNKKRQGA